MLQNNYQIILKGSAGGAGSTANTNIRATASGMILEIPIKEGDQVIQPVIILMQEQQLHRLQI